MHENLIGLHASLYQFDELIHLPSEIDPKREERFDRSEISHIMSEQRVLKFDQSSSVYFEWINLVIM